MAVSVGFMPTALTCHIQSCCRSPERLDFIRFEEEVLHHLSSSAEFVGAPLLTVGIEISQKQNRRRELTDKGLQFSDTVCCRGRKIYGTLGWSTIIC